MVVSITIDSARTRFSAIVRPRAVQCQRTVRPIRCRWRHGVERDVVRHDANHKHGKVHGILPTLMFVAYMHARIHVPSVRTHRP